MTESLIPDRIEEPVSVDDNATTLTVDISQTGTNNDVDVLTIAAGDNNIGNVDVVTLPALVAGAANIGDVDIASPLGAGTEAAAMRVTVATDSTGVLSVDDNGGALTVDQATAANLNAQVVGAAAHDAANSGNPVLVSASHETIADTAPTNRLATVTDGDVTRFSATDGTLFVIPTGPQAWQTVNLGLLTGATVKAAPGVGLSLYVTAMQFSIGAATASSIKLTISGGADMVGPHYLEAINGRGVAIYFPTPLKVTANTALLATSTGSATATLNVQGFTAPG